MCQVNLLHCLVQSESEGGENQLVDTLRVAAQLRESYPQHYNALTKTLVDWSDEGEESGRAFRSLYRAPVIWYVYNHTILYIEDSQ
jgi:gamma-butyrobetaine dioxygenase